MGAGPPPDPLEWPASAWGPSAPESYLLLHFQRPEPKEALKLGILELIARRRLRLVEVVQRGLLGRTHKGSVLAQGASGAPLSAPLELLWGVFRSQQARTFLIWPGSPRPADQSAALSGEEVQGVEVEVYARAVIGETGSLEGYLSEWVRAALVERGWVQAQRYRMLRLFPATRWVLTPAGVAAQGDLLWRVEYGNRELGQLVDDDPPRALAFAGLAGAAVLLMDDARPHLQRLRQRLAAGGQGDATGTGSLAGAAGYGAGGTVGDAPAGFAAGEAARDVGATADIPSGPQTIPDMGMAGIDAGPDLSGLDFSGLAFSGLDLGALGGLDAAVSAVDAGVDAGASGADGGGGDGGGGDGGGS